MSESSGPQDDTKTTIPISSLEITPEMARLLQAQMAVATGRPTQLMGLIVLGIVATVFTVVIVGIVGFMVVAGIQEGNPLLFAGVGLLLFLAIPYFVLYQHVVIFKATKPRPKRSSWRA